MVFEEHQLLSLIKLIKQNIGSIQNKNQLDIEVVNLDQKPLKYKSFLLELQLK